MGKFTQYQIALASMADGVYEYDFDVNGLFFKELEIADVLDASVKVHLVVTKKHDAYHLDFGCEGEVTVPCDRCLDPLTLPVDTDYILTVKYGEEYNDDADDILVLPENELTLDVAPIIKDTILLGLPSRRVHEEGECNAEMQSMLQEHGGGFDDDDEI